MTVADIVHEAELKGIRDFGLTDHLHTPYNLPDIDFEKIGRMLENAGIKNDFWCLEKKT